MTAIEFLRRYRPGSLVKSSARGEYQLAEHDSFKINGESSVWHWKSRDIGGKSALKYLIYVEGVPFVEAVQLLSKNNINTLAQLETHRQALQTEIRQLLTKRMYATPSLPRKGLMSVLTTAAMSGRDLTSCLPSMREPLSGRWRRKASAPRKASSTAG